TKPAAPTAKSTASGVVSVTWPATSDLDNADLTYHLYRDGGSTPIATSTAHSVPWTLPALRFRDAGLAVGSSHTYTVNATDGVNTSPTSPASPSVIVTGTNPGTTYPGAVLADHPTF